MADSATRGFGIFHFNDVLMCVFLFVILMWKITGGLVFILGFSFRMASPHTTRSKATPALQSLKTVLPLKKVSKVGSRKKPVVEDLIVLEKPASPVLASPLLSQSDLARQKVATVKAAGEAARAKRLQDQADDLAALESAAKELEDFVMKETAPTDKEITSKNSRSRSRSHERRHSPKRRSHSPRRRSRSPGRRSRSPNGRRSKSPDRGRNRYADHDRNADKDRITRSYDRRSEAPRRGSEEPERYEGPRRLGESDKRRSRSRSPPRHAKNSWETSLPYGSGKGSSRKGPAPGYDGRSSGPGGYEGKSSGSKEKSVFKERRSRSPRRDVSSNDDSGDESRVPRGGEERSKERSKEDILFVRAPSIPEEVEKMALVISKMDQACTGVGVRGAMLLDAIVNLLPSGSREQGKGSLFATFIKTSSVNGAAAVQASSFGLEKLAQAIVSKLCLRVVRRLMLCPTADIPIMAFSAANSVILGVHDPVLPKLASKDSKLIDVSSHTTFNELVLFMVRWSRVVYLVDPVYGSAINGLTCVAIEMHTNRESVMVIHEYVQIMKKLVTGDGGGETFYPLFFILQMQTLEQARLAVAEKARAKETESKPLAVEAPTWTPKTKLKGVPKIQGKALSWAAPVGREKAAIMDVGATMSDAQLKSSSCHGWNNGTACSKLSPEGNCFFAHVCNVCLSTKHGRSQCSKRPGKKE